MIHRTAIVDPKAKLALSVKIGPYCVIGPNVEIDENEIMNAINELVEIKDVNDFSNIGRIIIAAKRDDPAAAESPYNPQGKPQNYNPFTPQQQPYDPDDSYSKYLKERKGPDDYYGPAGANA